MPGATLPLPLRAKLAWAVETPARAATSRSVARLCGLGMDFLSGSSAAVRRGTADYCGVPRPGGPAITAQARPT
ncbi:hypothetical protein Nans01_45770 [Nocardiopsis ansamitocini]|uniref:Uncharacterized protein n=1 Tax=Nocardiopsis ansamitocini TaxID=1670832 RepID=A0A9W6PB06_9ACTN|nr:hypothetical protein Nans01_45770 [Nocardiopsis ansamitocini]